MPYASPYHELNHLYKQTFRHTQHIKPAAYRDGHCLKAISPDFTPGDELRPHLITTAPFILSVTDDAIRRFHPTRDPDRYFELGHPLYYIDGGWREVGFHGAKRHGNRLAWQQESADMQLIMNGHELKLEIELKNGFIPPDNILAFPLNFSGLSHHNDRILVDGRQVMRMSRPEVYDAADPRLRATIPHHFVRSAGQELILFTLPHIRHMQRPIIDPSFEYQPAEAASKDTYLSSAAPATNYETNALLIAHSATFHTILEFDLSSIPSNATCLSASLSLWSAATAPGASMLVYQLHSNVATWVESEATWTNYKAATAWPGSAGASTSGTDYQAVPVGTITYPNMVPNTEAQVAIAAAIVQAWFDTPNTNYGLLIKGIASQRDWHSSSAVTAAYRPQLTVLYSIIGTGHSSLSLYSAIAI